MIVQEHISIPVDLNTGNGSDYASKRIVAKDRSTSVTVLAPGANYRQSQTRMGSADQGE